MKVDVIGSIADRICRKVRRDVEIGACTIVFEKHCAMDVSHKKSNYEQ